MKIHFTPSRFRLTIQAAFTLFCLYAGYRFVLFLQWAADRADTFTPKPGAVEGFLPISALMGFRQLLETGDWDPVHPAGLSIFIAVLLMAFLFRKGFCGYVCPVGFLSNLLERAGRALGLDVTPHRYVNKAMAGIKYLLLGGFCFAILSMDSRSLTAFITGPYNMVADGRDAPLLHRAVHPLAHYPGRPGRGGPVHPQFLVAATSAPTARCSACCRAWVPSASGATELPA